MQDGSHKLETDRITVETETGCKNIRRGVEGHPEDPGGRDEGILEGLDGSRRTQQGRFQRPPSGEKAAEQIGAGQRGRESHGGTFHRQVERGLLPVRSRRQHRPGPVRDLQEAPPALATHGNNQELPVPQADGRLRGPVQEDPVRARVEGAQRGAVQVVPPEFLKRCFPGNDFKSSPTLIMF